MIVVGLCGLQLLWPDGRVGQVTYIGAIVGAGVAAWISVYRFRGTTRIWLAVGISASALADVVYLIVSEVNGAEPDTSVADILWILSYVGIGVAMLQMLRRGHGTTRRDVDGMIDATVVMLVTVLLLWQYWMDASLTDASVPLGVRAVWASYPILDAALLAFVVRSVIAGRGRSGLGLFIPAGVLCWLASDFGFMMGIGTGLVADLFDVGWMLGAACLAAGCWRIPDHDGRDVDVDDAHGGMRVAVSRVGLGLVPLLVPSVIEFLSHSGTGEGYPISLLAATAAFIVLAGLRAIRLINVGNHARDRLEASEQLYRALSANSSDAVLVLDAEGRITNDAPNLESLLGRSVGGTSGHHALDFLHDGGVETTALFDRSVLAPGVVLDGEAHLTRTDGNDLWLSVRAVNLLDLPNVCGVVVNLHDITDRKRAEEDLVHQAFHDSLTGLANRALFRDRVEHALRRRARSGFDPAVIYLDLDGFKKVNDRLGHDAGDQLLCEVAGRLLAIVRTADTVARLGGDEFAVLVEESPGVRIEAEAIAERLLDALNAEIVLGPHVVALSASLGIAYGQAESTAPSLLRDADVAMYQAKTTGRNRAVVFDPLMRAIAMERLQLENDLTGALSRDEFVLHYQPVIELASNRLVGFEALLRWEHPTQGTVQPDRFIPLAEENGMIIPIGQWVLDRACHTAARWLAETSGPLTMAVNLSGRQLASAGLVREVEEALAVSGLPAAALILEMTETVLVQDASLASARLHKLHELGVHLAIDDFGTGYSSLGYLRQFPVDILKIDKSFVSAITERDTVPPLVRGLLDLGRTLQLEIVAEGIETEAQLGQLRDQQCQYGQGYLFARPLSPDAAEQFLRTMTWVPA